MTTIHNRRRLQAILVLLAGAMVAVACGSGDTSEVIDTEGSAPPTEEVAPTATPAAEPDPTATPEPTEAPTATPEPTAAATATPEPPPPACEEDCFSEDERARIEELLTVYGTGDWDAFTALFGTPEPIWNSDLGEIGTMYIEADFGWSLALNQQITLDDCVERDGGFVCQVIVEDDMHRAMSEQGLEPSRCRMDFAIEPETTQITYYNIGTCFLGYDSFFHDYGAWYEATYPEEETVQGFHYRAWNQFGEGAPERAAAHLDEFAAAVAGGDAGHGAHGEDGHGGDDHGDHGGDDHGDHGEDDHGDG